MLALHGIINKVWAIDEGFALNYLPIIGSWLKNEPTQAASPREAAEDHEKFGLRIIPVSAISATPYKVSEWGYKSAPEQAPKDSIAIIDINGVMTKYDQDCGPAGMQTKSDLLSRCFANDFITGIILNVDSGGGEAGSMFLLAETLKKRNKPVIGFANDFACSAAYGILSACDLIIANSEICRVGSIGTYLTLADFSAYYEKLGIKITDIYASASTEKNSEFKQAIQGNVEPLRKMIDVINNKFHALVTSGRGDKLTGDKEVWSKGKTMFATEAKAIGLIDKIDSFDNVLNYFNTL
jgi:ClpP class serine protease